MKEVNAFMVIQFLKDQLQANKNKYTIANERNNIIACQNLFTLANLQLIWWNQIFMFHWALSNT